MLYRCGWCGCPTDENGKILTTEEANSMCGDWNCAEQTQGDCCPNGSEQECQMVTVTREMAMDAGEPTMEGMRFNGDEQRRGFALVRKLKWRTK